MGRALRKWNPGCLYHVIGELTGRSRLFSRTWAVEAFLTELRRTRERSGMDIVAWCILPDEYNLVVRWREVPPWRSMAGLHSGFSRQVNRRRRSRGPVWAGRYRAVALLGEEVADAIAHIHALPLVRGIVDRVSSYPWSGHHELLNIPAEDGLISRTVRSGFRTQLLEAARRIHADSDRYSSRRQDLPWWTRPSREETGNLGRYSRFFTENAEDYLALARTVLGIERSGRSQWQSLRRDLILWFGTARLGIPNRVLAGLEGLHPGSICRAAKRAEQRLLRETTPGNGALLGRLERAVMERWPAPASVRLCKGETWHRFLDDSAPALAPGTTPPFSRHTHPGDGYDPGTGPRVQPSVFLDPTPVDSGDFEGP